MSVKILQNDLHHVWLLNIYTFFFPIHFLFCHLICLFSSSLPPPSSKGKLSFCGTQQFLRLSPAEFKQLCKGECFVGCLGTRWEQGKQGFNICRLSK